MAKFIISGRQKLNGEIKVFGAKNAAIKMIAAACLTEGTTILENVPDILDIQKIIKILEKLGVKFSRQNHRLEIDTTNLKEGDPDPAMVGSIRASVVLVGALLNKFGRIRIPHPGGCMIGPRPITLHEEAFRKFGVSIQEENGYFLFTFSKNDKTPVTINFPKISVGATENILLFASCQERITTINNAAIEPEILDLVLFLQKTGAKIEVKDRTIKIQGNANLQPTNHQVIPDRIEAGTFLIMAAATKSNLKVSCLNPKHLTALLDKFTKMKIEFDLAKDFIYIKSPGQILATDIATAEYPGFPTDLQPPMGVLLTQAQGKSTIKEKIFLNRLEYLKELEKMGAKINLQNNQEAEIFGPEELSGTKIHSLDLRAGATLLIAGLVAQGQTEIDQAENIDRGYEKIEERLESIGAQIKRIK